MESQQLNTRIGYGWRFCANNWILSSVPDQEYQRKLFIIKAKNKAACSIIIKAIILATCKCFCVFLIKILINI